MKCSSGIFYAVLAAALYALSTPCSKLLLHQAPPTMLAALLYLGAGIGMSLTGLVCRKRPRALRPLDKRDLPALAGMIGLDIAAPILLMAGLTRTTAANAALLNNFEIAATSVIALALFHEAVSRRVWCAVALVTAGSALLSVEGTGSFRFSFGSALVLLACVCWGVENNCTRTLSTADPLTIVVLKGFGSGTGSLLIALARKEALPDLRLIAAALALGYVAYGLSIFFYIYAQRFLGAARTSTYYATAPFLSAGLSLLLFRQLPNLRFWAALALMAAGAFFASTEPADAVPGPKAAVSR